MKGTLKEFCCNMNVCVSHLEVGNRSYSWLMELCLRTDEPGEVHFVGVSDNIALTMLHHPVRLLPISLIHCFTPLSLPLLLGPPSNSRTSQPSSQPCPLVHPSSCRRSRHPHRPPPPPPRLPPPHLSFLRFLLLPFKILRVRSARSNTQRSQQCKPIFETCLPLVPIASSPIVKSPRSITASRSCKIWKSHRYKFNSQHEPELATPMSY